jgi:hypothetical protein
VYYITDSSLLVGVCIMNCDSTDVLIATYGINWQSMVTVISGPYESLENCQASCGGTTTTTTTGEPTTSTTTTTGEPTTSTTTSPTTSTTTTEGPFGIQPPLVVANYLFNINDISVNVFLDRSTDEGQTWIQYTTIELADNTQTSLPVGYTYRARCSPLGEGSELSEWSFGYTYPNPDNVAPPVCSANNITNINDFSVHIALERSVNNGLTWIEYTIIPLAANAQIQLPAGYIYRGRCAQQGSGISVSAMSS